VSKEPAYAVELMPPGYDLGGIDFDCGQEPYNDWLHRHAPTAVKTGSASVYILRETSTRRLVGYFTVTPTTVAKDDLPGQILGGLLRTTPGYLIGKLALDKTLQARWREDQGLPKLPGSMGRQLVLAAVAKVVEAASRGGGQVIVVDADNLDLVPYYEKCGFIVAGEGRLRLYMKVATARAELGRD